MRMEELFIRGNGIGGPGLGGSIAVIPRSQIFKNAIRQVDREMFANGFVEKVVSTTDCIIKKAEERLSRIIDQQNEMLAEREGICG